MPAMLRPSADCDISKGIMIQPFGWLIHRRGVNLTAVSPGTTAPSSSNSPVGRLGFSEMAQKQKRAFQEAADIPLVIVSVTPVRPCMQVYWPCQTPSRARDGVARKTRTATKPHRAIRGKPLLNFMPRLQETAAQKSPCGKLCRFIDTRRVETIHAGEFGIAELEIMRQGAQRAVLVEPFAASGDFIRAEGCEADIAPVTK
jgi:hypothetical protein